MIRDRKTRQIYSEARLARDRNFDGRFYFAVRTTGVFCRPSCPSPPAKEENVEYYESIFGPMENGFRPCRRCRPDLNTEYHSSYITGSETVERALDLIYSGFLSYNSIDELAAEVCISPRQLRKLFIDCIGIPPVKIGRYHKAVFAKKLLMSSDRPITETAFAAGFRSTRQFNSAYHDIFGETPTETRRLHHNPEARGTVMQLKYRKPFEFREIISFMKPRLIKGVEIVEDGVYFRSFRTSEASGWFSVADRPADSMLELSVYCDDVRCIMEIYYRVRLMFDLDTDFTQINGMLGSDPLLAGGMTDGRTPRLPAAFDPFEFTVRAILGQQITVKAATTLAARIAKAAGIQCPGAPDGIDYYFPVPNEIAALNLGGLGITGTRQQTIKTVTAAVIDGRLNLDRGQRFKDFSAAFGSLKGIGAWTVNYTAMRGLGMKDAFPASDLGIIKAIPGKRSVKQIEAEAEKWRPYRSYAALCLWNIPPTPAE